MKYLLLALVLLVATAVLLGRRGRPQASRSDSPDPSASTPGRSINVETDPAIVRAHVEVWQRELLARFDAERLAELDFLDYELSETVANHSRLLIPLLERIAADRSAPRQARSNASFLLAKSGRPLDWSPIHDSLRYGDVAEQQLILSTLGYRFEESELRMPIEFQSTVLDLIASPHPPIREASAFLAFSARIPEASERIAASFDSADPEGKATLSYWVAQHEDSERLPQIVKLHGQVPNEHRVLTALTQFLEAQSPSTRRTAEDALVSILLPRISRDRFVDFPQSTCSKVLSLGDSDRTVALAQEVLSRSSDRHLRGLALECLARLRGQHARATLLDHVNDEKLTPSAVNGLGVALRGTGDANAIAAIVHAAATQPDTLRIDCASAIASIGGPEASSAAREIKQTDEDPNATRQRALAHLERLALVDPRVIEHVRASSTDETGPVPQVAFNVLGECGLTVAFDVETGVIPCRHDLLIESLAKGSRGAFRPEACTEDLLQTEPEDPDPVNLVRFVHAQRLYTFEARYLEDWYDVPATVAAIHRALADAGRQERFIALDPEGQIATFIFGPPTLLNFLEEFDLPVTADLSKARTLGRAFEKEVLDRWNEK